MTAQPVRSDQAGRQPWVEVLRSPGLVGLKLAPRVVFLLLWEWAGRAEGSLSIRVAGIADALRLRERHVRDCLHGLAATGAIDVSDWFRDGTVNLFVNAPDSNRRSVRRASPQAELFEDPPAPESTEPPATLQIGADDRELAELAARKKRQVAAEQKPGGEVAFGTAAAEALQDAVRQLTKATDPAEQKRRLVAKIKGVVRDGNMNDSFPGRAVDLVIGGKAYWSDVQRILDGIRGIREQGKKFKTSPGAYFTTCIRKLPGWNENKRG